MGKAKSLKKRVASYFSKQSLLLEKTKSLIVKTSYIRYVTVTSEIESLLLEANYIKKFSPMFNVRLTDGKAYPLVRITVKETYPALLVARRMEDSSSVYLGPYPNVGDMKLVLKTIRRIFPFQSVQNHPNRPCLYNHLGLCPCPTVFNTQETRRNYRKTIQHIVSFLKGNIKKVIQDLEKERDALSQREAFEDARLIQQKIDAITSIVSPIHTPFEYHTNPNLRQDLREKELLSLRKVLQKKEIVINLPNRIECFDISNIMGKFATGSMVVFTHGEKDAVQYRRFRVRLNQGKANDIAMMKEVLLRRLKHAEWPLPDLLIVDGGKGQVNAAVQIVQLLKKVTPVIGLAKREEVIVTANGSLIKLPKDEPALHLIMRIRDEAHRFAITYHKKLRSKYFLSSTSS